MKINVAFETKPTFAAMVFTEALLPLPSYPDRMPQSRMREVVHFTQRIALHISGLALTENFIGTTFSAFGDIALNLPEIAAEQTKRSYENAQLTAANFEAATAEAKVPSKVISESCNSAEVTSRLLRHARLHDITITSLVPTDQIAQYEPEAVLFESGRPVVVIPQNYQCESSDGIGIVVIAWDFGGPAARAVADALPILRAAKSVKVLTVENEKPIESGAAQAEFRHFLARRGVDATLDREDARGRSIGEVLTAYMKQHRVDLLVMGAYGHSRLREFVLGGATASMLASPPVPVLLSR
jgi:nucleotide-binding universal stress UspA family protein